MVASVVPLQVLQYGPETTAGTLVPAVRVVDHTPGTAQLKRDIKPIVVRNAGSYATGHRHYPGQDGVEIDWTAPATFDRLTDYGNLFFADVSVGTGTLPRTWTFTPADTSDGLKRYSFEVGGTNMPSAYTVSGCVGKQLSISGKSGQTTPWEIKATVAGMVTTAGSLTGALAMPSTIKDVLWTQTKVYFDASTFGSTQQVGRAVSFDFNLQNGIDPRFTLDAAGTAYRNALSKERSVDCTIVVEYDSQTQYTAWAAGTIQKIRLEATGDAVGAGNYKATLDINGFWEALTLGNDNGVQTTQLKLRGEYDATLASDVKLVVLNSVSTRASMP